MYYRSHRGGGVSVCNERESGHCCGDSCTFCGGSFAFGHCDRLYSKYFVEDDREMVFPEGKKSAFDREPQTSQHCAGVCGAACDRDPAGEFGPSGTDVSDSIDG